MAKRSGWSLSASPERRLSEMVERATRSLGPIAYTKKRVESVDNTWHHRWLSIGRYCVGLCIRSEFPDKGHKLSYSAGLRFKAYKPGESMGKR